MWKKKDKNVLKPLILGEYKSGLDLNPIGRI